MDKSITIIGCGWLGMPLAASLVKSGLLVNGTTTTPDKWADIESIGASAHFLHLGEKENLQQSQKILDVDCVIIAIPPKVAYNGEDFYPKQVKLLLDNIDSAKTKVMLVSSSSVYPEAPGMYDEHFALSAENTGNMAIWTAEQHVLAHNHRNLVLRCSGLMGYNRIAGRYFAGKPAPGKLQPVNYIHRDDVIGVIERILEMSETSGVYNLVCPQHPTREEVYQCNSTKFGFEMPIWQTDGINRIITSVRIEALRYQFRYPDPLAFD